jgi:hypothetical protein
MFDYILRNKEWIFSGLGVSVLAAIIFLVRWTFSRQTAARLRSTRPLPAKIIRDIQKRPPLQRSEASQHYAGLRVRWKVAFSSSHSKSDGSVRLMLLDRGHYPWIYADVSVDDYPEIKTFAEGTKLWVSGSIQSCDGNTITLSDAKVTNA